MSSTAMWLLLAVVVIVILFASALYKRTFTPHELALTGVMAALSFAAYLFFRVPFYGGSSFHLGNTFTALAALLMDGVSGGLAGAIGLSLADILAGDPGYAVATFVLKFVIGVVCGLVGTAFHFAIQLSTQAREAHPWLLFCMPVAGLLIAAVAVVFALVVVLPLALLLAGAMLCGFSFALWGAPASAVTTLGCGLALLALGVLVSLLIIKLCMLFVPPVCRGLVALIRWPFDRLHRRKNGGEPQ